MAAFKSLTVEQRLIGELKRKRSELKRVEREILQLKLQINRVRRTGVGDAQPQRSTSVQRLTVEAAIIDRLSLSVPPETSADQLWPLVQALGVTSRSTLRSHLRRMKEKGIVVSPVRGRWRLTSQVDLHRNLKPELLQALAGLRR